MATSFLVCSFVLFLFYPLVVPSHLRGGQDDLLRTVHLVGGGTTYLRTVFILPQARGILSSDRL